MFAQPSFSGFGKPVVRFEPEVQEEVVYEMEEDPLPMAKPKKIAKPKYLPGERLLKTLNQKKKKDREKAQKARENNMEADIDSIMRDMNMN